MAGWVLVPCLVSLRGEFDQVAPRRDHNSDGSIGDAAHQQEPSDHNPDETGNTGDSHDADNINEVHAIDVDRDLNQPGWSMERAVAVIVERHRTGVDSRLEYVIFDRRICGRYNGWQWAEYFGANPHDHHAHFSARYDTASERNTEPWGLLAADQGEDTMSVQDVRDYFESAAAAVTKGNAATPQNRADRGNVAALLRYAMGWNYADQTGANLPPAQFARLAGAIAKAQQVDVGALAAAITPGLVAAIEARHPDGTLTKDDVEAAVRDVLTHGVDGN